MEVAVDKVWVGIDAGKEFHWVHVLDASGSERLSRKLANDEADISELEPSEEEVVELRILLGRRRDLLLDHNRTITRASAKRSCRSVRLWSGRWILTGGVPLPF